MTARNEHAEKWKFLEDGAAHSVKHNDEILLAQIFWYGKRWEDAAFWYRKAAQKGDALSQLHVGELIYSKKIVGSSQEMIYWFFCASQTMWRARYMLGECYRKERGVSLSYEESMDWLLMGEVEDVLHARRLEACYAFFLASPEEYGMCYAIEMGRSDPYRAFGKHNVWEKMTVDNLTVGLRRLTEYEASLKKCAVEGM